FFVKVSVCRGAQSFVGFRVAACRQRTAVLPRRSLAHASRRWNEHIDRRLRKQRKYTRSGHRERAACDGLAPGLCRGQTPPLAQTCPKRSNHAAPRLKALKQAPSARAKLVRQSLKSPRAGRWIGNLRKLCLMDQNELRIARKAPCKFVRQAKR